jgi:hypothetical protein
MKTLLALMIAIFSSGCATSVKPSPRGPAALPQEETDCPLTACGLNGTRLTGLTTGDYAGTVRTITLQSGEVITLQ